MMDVSEQEYVVIELYISFADRLRRAFKRMVGVFFNPFSTFDSIAEDPDLLGPGLLLLAYLLLVIASLWLYNSRIVVNYINETSGVTLKEFLAVELIRDPKILAISSVMTLLRLIGGWLLGLATLWLMNSLLKGVATGKSLLSASGYLIALVIADSLAHTALFLIAASTPIVVKVTMLSNPLRMLSIIRARVIEYLLANQSSLMVFDKFLWILFRAWILGSLVALSNSVMRISIPRALVAGIASFVAFLLGGWIG